ncbi:NADH:flavin oxidoreductase [Desulfosporosinus nitroreducens]|uniref:NADH:flavin oxidoreductase n=1 Tax=Desulfosporosinus nitroreducens TaxID=2018668 RepID=A0ABT8R1J0_9FIRM|nr:NADH:flavin oxidoreductase [Desulfosporosinus nitroreducens]MDO0825991.1 NADH:flavin oxidoreductase [Desulfosporosinus nitroreducens]
MKTLFDQTTIKHLDLPNRFVRSATWEGLASTDGGVTSELIEAMVELAKGGVGLIITGHSYVRRDGQAGPNQLGIYSDSLIPGLKDMTKAVHAAGGRIIMQLAHAGRFASEQLTGQTALAVSLVKDLPNTSVREMTIEDIQELAEAYSEAAERAKAAGFDGIQIHSAHGYLLSQFLSPAFNQRQDEYGGSIYNRSRIHLDIIQGIRRTVGHDYPILVKLNCQDFIENGLSLDDSLQVAHRLANAGVDAIELSGGVIKTGRLEPSRTGINSIEREAYFRNEARVFKREIDIPLILVGGIRSYELAEKLVETGDVDYISMCRPFIMEPGLINRWASGDHSKALCKSDNACLESGRKGTGVRCFVK